MQQAKYTMTFRYPKNKGQINFDQWDGSGRKNKAQIK